MKRKNILHNGLFDIDREIVKPKLSKLIDNISRTKIPVLSDEEGLSKAYDQPNKIYINNHKMYIAGTSNWQDVWDDLKIPFNLTRYSQRYEDAEKLLKEHPEVDSLISHSLGGAVALELNKNYPDKYDTTTYGSPTVDLGDKKGKRFRHPLDPISALDFGTYNVPVNVDQLLDIRNLPMREFLDPLKNHSYTGYGNQGKDDEGNIGSSFSYSRKK
jgi:pimeloyl-ACP methyl ester carboxylesterase